MRRALGFALFVIAGCTPAAVSATPAPPSLQPYLAATRPVSTALPAGIIVTPSTPLATPTPIQYTIQAGDTLSQIAEKFHISLDQLVAENPGLSPNAMPIGKVLNIPSSPAMAASQATPTAAPLPITQVACHRTANGGIWCFALVHNDTQGIIENVTGQVALVDADDRPLDSKVIGLPLDILMPDQSIPLAVYFAPGIAEGAIPHVQIFTAMQLPALAPRYLPATVQNSLAQVSWSGLTAELSGEVSLPADAERASTIWIVAVAYDQDGNVIGVRRWESEAGLSGGGILPFSFILSAVAGRIDRVEFAVEARP